MIMMAKKKNFGMKQIDKKRNSETTNDNAELKIEPSRQSNQQWFHNVPDEEENDGGSPQLQTKK